MGFWHAYMGIYGGSPATEVVPDIPGMEYRLPAERLHYSLPAERLHYQIPEES